MCLEPKPGFRSESDKMMRIRPDPDTQHWSYDATQLVAHLELVKPELVRVFLEQEGE